MILHSGICSATRGAPFGSAVAVFYSSLQVVEVGAPMHRQSGTGFAAPHAASEGIQDNRHDRSDGESGERIGARQPFEPVHAFFSMFVRPRMSC